MSRDQSAVGLNRASRITDDLIRPIAAILAPVAVWVSIEHCRRMVFTPCGEWGCADTPFIPANCVAVGSHRVELWAVAVLAVAFALCIFGGVHEL